MSNPDHPDDVKLASLGNLAMLKHIRETREAHSEADLVQIMDGALIAIFSYYANDVGSLKRIEDLLWFWDRRLHPEKALRDVEPEGRG